MPFLELFPAVWDLGEPTEQQRMLSPDIVEMAKSISNLHDRLLDRVLRCELCSPILRRLH